jgi:monoamine oxidase
MTKKTSEHIGIIGAGIAGLVSGLELQRAGHDVSVFEARSCAGGRIRSLQWMGMIVETGPEFIHGRLKETLALLKKYNIRYEAIDGKMYDARNGALHETREMAKGWNLLIKKMKSLKKDLAFSEFLNEYFPGPQYKELRTSAIRYAEGFDLADPETASTRALVNEWEQEDLEQYRIPSGYGTLVSALEKDFLQQGGKIFFDQPIENVDWSGDMIQLYTKGAAVPVEKLIVTLPLPLLNETAPVSECLSFFPELEEKKYACAKIGFGTVVKIVMIWNQAFWNAQAPDAQFIFSDHFIPTWWTQHPRNLPMLTGWLGGPAAERFAEEPESFFRERAIKSLSSIFSLSEEEIKNGLKGCKIFNWKKEPWSRGAYSYALVGSGDAQAICRLPVQNRIYFAGEAYYEGAYPGTVEAAIVNALATAKQIDG